jgi:hypothetical protein
MGGMEEGMAEVLVIGNAETVLVIPESVCLGERTEAFIYWIAVEWISPVCSTDSVQMVGDGNVGRERVDEGGVRVIRATRKWVSEVGFTRSPFDGVFITPDFFNPSRLPTVELPLVHEGGQALVVRVDG